MHSWLHIRRGLLPAAIMAGFAVLLLAGCYGTTAGNTYGAEGGVGYTTGGDYLYYPASGIYYNDYRHAYVYRYGNRWVERATPPTGWYGGAPSVHMEFHDFPARHDEDVRRRYPRNWRPNEEHEEHERRSRDRYNRDRGDRNQDND